jgi:hypothetical protein
MNSGCFTANTRAIDRARLRFSVIFSLAVLSLSFVLGLVLGLRKNAPPAYAAAAPAYRPGALKLKFLLPQGLDITPIGEKSTLNGRPAQTVSFRSSRGVREILGEQVKLWESAGYKAFNGGTNAQGAAVAVDTATGARYTITAWSVPETLREDGVNGQTAGIAAFVEGGEISGHDPERQGQIKGIPPMPGGGAGALFSTAEEDGRSQTTVYTNPGKVEQNVQFYHQLLYSSGWTSQNGQMLDAEKGAAALQFSRYTDELTLLFSEKRSSSTPKTVVVVTLRQLQ